MGSPKEGVNRRNFLRGATAVPISAMLAACGEDKIDKTPTSEEANANFKKFTEELGGFVNALKTLKKDIDQRIKETSIAKDSATLLKSMQQLSGNINSVLSRIADNGEVMIIGNKARKSAELRRDTLGNDINLELKDRKVLADAWQKKRVEPIGTSLATVLEIRPRIIEFLQFANNREDFVQEIIKLEATPDGFKKAEPEQAMVLDTAQKIAKQLIGVSSALEEFTKKF